MFWGKEDYSVNRVTVAGGGPSLSVEVRDKGLSQSWEKVSETKVGHTGDRQE